MNRIDSTLQNNNKIISIYFTAGYPALNDTEEIIIELEKSGVNMIEIGLPFSDPLADGPVIQETGNVALKNGMTTQILFNQLQNIRNKVKIPLLIMGYINPIVQYGVEAFCKSCAQVGIDGVIIPDLPVDIYQNEYQAIFEKYGIYNILLITPQTSEQRIRYIDSISKGFIYMVSTNATTGNQNDVNIETENYFKRIASYHLNNPQVVGFGIHDLKSYQKATQHQKGAIIGSDFMRYIQNKNIKNIKNYFKKYK